MLTDKEKQDIKAEAKSIMERFGKALLIVEKETEESEVVRNQDRRKEKEGNSTSADPDFREIMLNNAPKKSKDCIIAEKGAWV